MYSGPSSQTPQFNVAPASIFYQDKPLDQKPSSDSAQIQNHMFLANSGTGKKVSAQFDQAAVQKKLQQNVQNWD